MSILYVLIPLGLLMLGAAVWAFFWAVGAGQFDDDATIPLQLHQGFGDPQAIDPVVNNDAGCFHRPFGQFLPFRQIGFQHHLQATL